MPEFQRQVVIPNVQKCSLAWLELAKSEESALSLKILAVDALTQFTTHHPTHHRALQQNLYSFTLEHLQGSFPLASSASLLLDQPTTSLPAAAIRLHSALPLTGGKVGASVAWRKSVDSAIATIRSLLGTLRKTYGDVIPSTTPPSFPLPPLPDDPAIAVPLALDRIRCMVRLLVHLLATPTSRPVSMPLGSLSQLALKLIQSTTAEPAQPPQVPYEPIQRTVEAAAVPELRVAGCMLAQQLAQTCGKLFTPYVSRFLNAITYQLNQSSICSTQRKHFFATIVPLLAFTHTAAPSQSYTRLASHLVKALAPLLPPSSRPGQSQNEKEGERKGKKRARYEADELFSTPLALPSPSSSSKELCAYALDALQQLLPTLPLAIRDSIHRILLTILLHLPRTNQDRALSEHVARVYAACLGEGTSASGMLGVSVRAIQAAASAGDAQRTLHQFLHPRIPPHSGSGPSIDDLALFWKDEEDEETKEFRKGAEVVTAAELAKASEESPREVEMVDVPNTRPASAPVVSSEHPATAAPRTALPDFASPVLPLSTSSSMFQSTHTPAASIPSGAQSTSTFAPSSQAQSVLSSTNQGSETSKAASSSIISTSAYSSSKPLVTQSIPPLQAGSSSVRSPLPTYDDDDDEPIPQIDLASDTDEDET
ncbi:hypothetical protein FRC08_003729 [Ceratobasidium sp. 394]|nr:hypothetical protein FRC08_003729 [Ceratobasidium sp. 394]